MVVGQALQEHWLVEGLHSSMPPALFELDRSRHLKYCVHFDQDDILCFLFEIRFAACVLSAGSMPMKTELAAYCCRQMGVPHPLRLWQEGAKMSAAESMHEWLCQTYLCIDIVVWEREWTS
jgi:hypothetical protein